MPLGVRSFAQQLPDVYFVAEGYYTLAPARTGMNRLKVPVPPAKREHNWVLMDEQGHTWPFSRINTEASDLLVFDAPAERPLRFLYGNIPEPFLTEPPRPPPDPETYILVRFTGHRSLEGLQKTAGLRRPLQMLALWCIVAVFSFTALGTWYRKQIQ
ncbi:MAG: hypothetical protein JJU05_00510 [Verrucomicrobia bacterium]|nr:hypothetical protein [Verrucomicrobiota bacterium]MCH8526308.1 hypothetical protein [Kiritimatiellia bacterium]